MPRGGENGFDCVGVEPSRGHVSPQLGRRGVRGERGSVWAGLAHRLVGVRGAEDAARRRDRRAGASRGVPRPVEPLAQLNRELTQRGEPFRLAQHAQGQVRVQSHPLPLAGPERARLVPDRVRDTEPSEAVDQPGPPQAWSELEMTKLCGRPRRQLGDRLGVPEHEGCLEIHERRDRAEGAVDLGAAEHDLQGRLGVDDGVPRRFGVEPRQQPVGIGDHEVTEARVELTPAPFARDLAHGFRAPHPVGDLEELRELRDAGREGDRAAPHTLRPSPSVPHLVGGVERAHDRIRQDELLGQRSGHRRVLGDHAVDLAVSRDGELEADPEPMQGRLARAELPEPGSHPADAGELVVVLGRLERDVVAEPFRLLVRVGMAADADEERRVVDDRSFVLVQPDRLGEAERDQALAQDVFHRLSEAEIDAERQSSDDLGEPD